MNKKRRVVLAGGTGFIGRALARELLRKDFEVVVLTRTVHEREDDGIRYVEWDGEHIGEWIQHLNGAEAVVNLTGRNVNCRHTPENLREILESRVKPIRALAAAIHHHIRTPPRLWLQASAVGYYGNRRDRWCDEKTSSGDGRLAEVCRRWEETFFAAEVPKTRRVLFRIGIVLGLEGGALPLLVHYTRWFLGGTAGNGRQYLSWVHAADLIRMFTVALEYDNFFAGTYNAVAPTPVTNREFMRTLRRALYRPWCPPAPAWMIKLICKMTNTEPSLVLEGCRCAPKRFQETGFEFQFPELRGALKDLCR